MRRKSLKLTLLLAPSKIFVTAIITLHTTSSFFSLFLALNGIFHWLFILLIAASLCLHIQIYNAFSQVSQLRFEGQMVCLNYHKAHHSEQCGLLLPKAWILPWLCIIYINFGDRKLSLPIFLDSVSTDEFRQLKVFLLRGPLFQQPANLPTNLK
jgi:hypothetical protein